MLLEYYSLTLQRSMEAARRGDTAEEERLFPKAIKLFDMLNHNGRHIEDIEYGSIIFHILCPTLSSLEDLWASYVNADLREMFQKSLITKEFLSHFHLPSMRLAVNIDTDDYLRCRQFLTSDGK